MDQNRILRDFEYWLSFQVIDVALVNNEERASYRAHWEQTVKQD